MFIAHGEKFRKHARWIMAGVLVMLIPGFIALFTTTGRSDRRGSDLPTIRGKPVDAAVFEQAENLVQAQFAMEQGHEVRKTSDNMDRVKQEAVLQMLLDRKAQELGLQVSDAELDQQIRIIRDQSNKNGQFDLVSYLKNRGVSEAAFEKILRTQLLHEKLQQLVMSAARATPTEVQQMYLPLHEKLTIDLVRFDVDNYKTPVIVSNEEVRAFFEDSKESFRTPAKVKVRYAVFPIVDAQKTIKLSDEEINEFYERSLSKYADTNNVTKPLEAVKDEVKAELLKLRAERAAGDQATELTVKLVRQTDAAKPDFTKLCAGMNVVVKETDYLSAKDKLPELGVGPDFLQRAFSLTPDQPYSDPIAGSNALYVLEYIDGKPSAIPPFEDVRENATEQVKTLRRYAATLDQARTTVEQLKKLVAGGKTFTNACAELKLKMETPSAFTVSDQKLDLPAAASIQQMTLGMQVGAISDLVNTLTGAVVFHLRDRQAANLADFEKDKEQLTRQVLQRNRQALFNDWIQALIRAEQVDFKIKPRATEAEEPAAAN